MNKPTIMYTFPATIIDGEYKGKKGFATYENDFGNVMFYFAPFGSICLDKKKIKYTNPVAKKDIVRAVLENRSCVSAKELAMWVKRDIGLSMTPAGVAGVLRPMVASGEVASSNCGIGNTVYWVNKGWNAVSEKTSEN